jgi:beta-glucosidase
MPDKTMKRRDLLRGIPAAGAAFSMNAQSSSSFPANFLWGAATAAYQVEGNNVNSDLWVLEYLQPSMFPEKSGDACDHYHRYVEDIETLAKLGFNAYRFSIEWARIEPEKGQYSLADRDHYRRMLAACRDRGLTSMVTLPHFTNPRWVAAQGGWENEATIDDFARFTEFAAKGLGDLMGAACTFNEPTSRRCSPGRR